MCITDRQDTYAIFEQQFSIDFLQKQKTVARQSKKPVIESTETIIIVSVTVLFKTFAAFFMKKRKSKRKRR